MQTTTDNFPLQVDKNQYKVTKLDGIGYTLAVSLNIGLGLLFAILG